MSAASPAVATAVARPRRHRLEGESPYGLQRRRIVAAMAELAASEGRDGVRIDALLARAQVSKTTFYELFTDIEDSFAAAVKRAFDRLFAGIGEVVEQVAVDGPEHRAAVTIAALIAVLDQDRETARLCLVEAYSGNPVARSLRSAAVHRLAQLFADGFEPEDQALHDALARTAAGAILGLAENALLEDPERPLRDLTRSAVYHGLVPFTDREIATAWAENPPAVGGDLTQLRPDGPDVRPGEQRMYT
ncbi:MAG TPA: TetR/AcrR family transcriptional regulator, partial [Thermoleophilaceae bacterium]